MTTPRRMGATRSPTNSASEPGNPADILTALLYAEADRRLKASKKEAEVKP